LDRGGEVGQRRVHVIGIDKEAKYLKMAGKRIRDGWLLALGLRRNGRDLFPLSHDRLGTI
jgi:hypothetical protein